VNEPPHPLRGIPPGDPRSACDEPAPPALHTAIEQFNARDFFECHETLEALWNAEPGPRRILYKGILQVGVGCYHLLRGNYRGTLIKLQTGADYLVAFEPACAGVAVTPLIASARHLRQAVVALGPTRIAEVDRALIPAVHPAAPREKEP
jgi:predicted metal-dependent hydrolase